MICDEIRELMQLFMDSELDARPTLGVQRHLESCCSCSRLLDSLLKQDQLLKDQARAEPINSVAVRERILISIRDQLPKPGRRWLSLPIPWHIAAVAAFTLTTVFFVVPGEWFSGNSRSVYAAAASDHAAHCSIETARDAITDPEELNRLAAIYCNRSLTPDLSRFGYTPPRGSICLIKELEFLHLIYYDPKDQPLSVFMRPHTPDLIPDEWTLRNQDDYKTASISRAGVDLLVVSLLDRRRMSTIANAIASQL